MPQASLPQLTGDYREFFILQDKAGKPLPNHPYEMFLDGALFAKERTDAQGRTKVASTSEPERVSAEPGIEDDRWFYISATYWDGATPYELDFLKDGGQEA